MRSSARSRVPGRNRSARAAHRVRIQAEPHRGRRPEREPGIVTTIVTRGRRS